MKSNEEKILLKLAKKVVEKQTYKNLKNLAQDEIIHATKYAIITALEKKYEILSKKAKNNFKAENLLLIVPSKIKHFKVNYDKDEFYKVCKLLSKIEKEIQNVAI